MERSESSIPLTALAPSQHDTGYSRLDEQLVGRDTGRPHDEYKTPAREKTFVQRVRPDGDGWITEIACLCLSIAAFGALVGFLAAYHNHPLSSFGSSTSINVVISMLVTVSEFSLLYAVSEALCQQKWLHMAHSQIRGRPLIELQRFDKAAYSGYAALSFLGHTFSSGYGFMALLGATAVIAHLLIGPFAQQAVFYPTRSAIQPDGYSNATITRALSYNGSICRSPSIFYELYTADKC
jgi:hypothetical protein